jgi:hypothetical protein
MKKLLPTAALLIGILYLSSCNKGDDNPYGDWRCTCFITKNYVISGTKYTMKDTSVLLAEDMDKESATAFCNTTQLSYVDTIGSFAKCAIK